MNDQLTLPRVYTALQHPLWMVLTFINAISCIALLFQAQPLWLVVANFSVLLVCLLCLVFYLVQNKKNPPYYTVSDTSGFPVGVSISSGNAVYMNSAGQLYSPGSYYTSGQSTLSNPIATTGSVATTSNYTWTMISPTTPNTQNTP